MPELSDSMLATLSDFLGSQTGLHFPKERWRDLERGILSAACESGQADAASFVHRLLSAPPTQTQIEGLASHLTVGETYFFREKGSLDIFEQDILPPLLQARVKTGKHLRIWSAGCCTGEEPYSIAMLLDRLVPDIDTWNLTILATDINQQSLRKAVRGIYGAWSFRTTPDWLRERYFTKRQDGHYEILPRIRQMVSFTYLNLAEEAYPSRVNDTDAMDVIFCRNVLMYFTPQQTRNVVARMRQSLLDGGWLITSPAECSNALFSEFSPVEFAGAFMYRKTAAGSPEAAMATQSGPWPDAETAAFVSMPSPQPVPEVEDEVTCERGKNEKPLHKARACADEGRLAEASLWCEQAISDDKLNPAHYYLLAVIRQAQGQNASAVHSLRRALYVDPDFVLAHFALANLYFSEGHQREAQRHYSSALELLGDLPADALLPESDGLRASRLVEIITTVQATQSASRREEILP